MLNNSSSGLDSRYLGYPPSQASTNFGSLASGMQTLQSLQGGPYALPGQLSTRAAQHAVLGAAGPAPGGLGNPHALAGSGLGPGAAPGANPAAALSAAAAQQRLVSLQQLGLGQAPRVGLGAGPPPPPQQQYAAALGGLGQMGRAGQVGPMQQAGLARMGGMQGALPGGAAYGANLAQQLHAQHRGAAPGYAPPSGDLLVMLGKASVGGGGLPPFDASDFPSLGAGGGPGRAAGASSAPRQDGLPDMGPLAGPGAGRVPGLAPAPSAPGQLPEDEFPALPGSGRLSAGPGQAPPGAQAGPSRAALAGPLGSAGPPGQAAGPAAASAGAAPPPGADTGAGRAGLLGLQEVITMTSSDVTMLALGQDLTTLGLNLNSPDTLWRSFVSPWAPGDAGAAPLAPARSGGAAAPPPPPRLPAEAGSFPECYLSPPPPLHASHYARFQPDTLFYVFYALPGDEAQLLAADELCARGWSYHREFRAWLTPVGPSESVAAGDRAQRGSFFVFDPAAWEIVRKDNLLVQYDLLERAPGIAPPRQGPPPPQLGQGGGPPAPPPRK